MRTDGAHLISLKQAKRPTETERCASCLRVLSDSNRHSGSIRPQHCQLCYRPMMADCQCLLGSDLRLTPRSQTQFSDASYLIATVPSTYLCELPAMAAYPADSSGVRSYCPTRASKSIALRSANNCSCQSWRVSTGSPYSERGSQYRSFPAVIENAQSGFPLVVPVRLELTITNL